MVGTASPSRAGAPSPPPIEIPERNLRHCEHESAPADAASPVVRAVTRCRCPTVGTGCQPVTRSAALAVTWCGPHREDWRREEWREEGERGDPLMGPSCVANALCRPQSWQPGPVEDHRVWRQWTSRLMARGRRGSNPRAPDHRDAQAKRPQQGRSPRSLSKEAPGRRPSHRRAECSADALSASVYVSNPPTVTGSGATAWKPRGPQTAQRDRATIVPNPLPPEARARSQPQAYSYVFHQPVLTATRDCAARPPRRPSPMSRLGRGLHISGRVAPRRRRNPLPMLRLRWRHTPVAPP